MKVFKFGGASVKDAAAVKNVHEILGRFQGQRNCVIFSAMGKTTNALEMVAEAWMKHDSSIGQLVSVVMQYHLDIARDLAIDKTLLDKYLAQLSATIKMTPPDDYDAGYDVIVSFGELLSTAIISTFLSKSKVEHVLLDARELVITRNAHRNAAPDWDVSLRRITDAFKDVYKEGNNPVVITQGFIGSTIEGEAVTLGREGSDFSAAIFAWALDAEEMIIWKDVPGVLNADPRIFNDTVKLERMSYRDAIELAYYGASVIHPKTIQPLQSKQIPLHVKSFYHPGETGTLIHSVAEDAAHQIPSFIVKPNQVLVSISPRDFSFIAEDNLHIIFGLLAALDIHLNMMQHSAISFSIVMDDHPEKVQRLFEELGSDFRVRYNKGLQLITIRYYDQPTIDRVINRREVLLEQKSRTTMQLVVSE